MNKEKQTRNTKKNDRPAGKTGRPKNQITEQATVDKKYTTSRRKSKSRASKNETKKPDATGTLNGVPPKAPQTSKPLNLEGISEALAAKAGIRHASAIEANDLCVLEQSGKWIPYSDSQGKPVMFENEDGVTKPYGRLRMDRPERSKKYHQERGSGVYAYFPPGVKLNAGRIVIVEGERKGLSLQGQGVDAIGISGFYGFQNRDGDKRKLLDELEFLRSYNGQEGVEFLGDNDTTLNHQFADAAIQLMERIGDSPEVSDVTLELPRIPFGEQKGIDDLIQKWLDEGLDPKTEYQKLERVTINLKEDGGKRGAAGLRWKLLKVELDRDPEGLKELVGSSPKQANRLFGLIAMMKDAALSQKAAKDAVRALLGMEKREFNAALKRAQEGVAEGVSEAAKNEEEEIRSKILEVAKKGHCIKGEILYPRDPNDPTYTELVGEETGPRGYMRMNREDFVEYLVAEEGLSKSPCGFFPGKQSSIKNTFVQMNKKPNVTWAGPIAAYPEGYHTYASEHFLVTEGPTFLEGEKGECTTTIEYLERMFGRDADEPHWEHQLHTFYGLVAATRRMIRFYKEARTVQPLVLVGPKGAGKTNFQTEIIPSWLGGRWKYAELKDLMSSFNPDQARAELIILSDADGNTEHENRTVLSGIFKKRAANPMDRLERKGVDKITVPSKRLLLVSANDDEKSIAGVPPVDGIEDKVIYLRTHRIDLWKGNDDPKAKKVVKKMEEEREAFCWFVDNFKLPEECQDSRFGVKGWQHPSLVALSGQGAPSMHLAGMIQDFRYLGSCETVFHTGEWVTAAQIARDLKDPAGVAGNNLKAQSVGSSLGYIKAEIAKGTDFGFTAESKTVNGVLRWSINYH